jgi:DNA-binding transcriptional ArsR family regulator
MGTEVVVNGRPAQAPRGSPRRSAAQGAEATAPSPANMRTVSSAVEVDVSAAARLIGEPARAAMLDALLAGRALAAGELARVAGVSPATASEHLARLREGGLVEVVVAGRHRYYRLASPDVAQALEALAMISPSRPVRSLRQSQANLALADARTCYDHLAGRLGVALHDALIERSALRVGTDGYDLSATGEHLMKELGVDVPAARSRRRSFARPCLDFTERRSHLAGALGAAICDRALQQGWVVRRARDQRGLHVNDAGRRCFSRTLGVS